ncbi:hypothetical protein D7X98_04800 [bacterium 1XD8-76]|nr:hypothetical protein D7X98_04800 [bacterium 1XD8-76]
MRKEDLFEILGELDDRIVEEAGRPVRKRINWKALGTMAACLTLMCIAFGSFSFTDRFGSRSEEAPMEESPMEEASAEEAPMEESPMEEASAEEAPAEEPSEEAASAGDIAPMAYVNGTLYIQSSAQEGYAERREEFSYLGRIESAVTQDREPDQNFQANDPIIGCEVYQYGEDIVIEIGGRYWRYVKKDGEGENDE